MQQHYNALSLDDRLLMDIQLRREERIKQGLAQGANPNYCSPVQGHVITKALGKDIKSSRIRSMLLDAGADINGADQDGNTLLHLTVMESTPSIGELENYIKMGLDLDRLNNQGLTPVGCAVFRSEWRSYSDLQHAGCNLELCAHKGMTSLLELAISLLRSSMARNLIDHGVKIEEAAYRRAKLMLPALAEQMEPVFIRQRLLDQASEIPVFRSRSVTTF